jgi:hypothetical protein
MTPQRRALPQRRHCETFDLAFQGFDKKYHVTLGYYRDGTLGEVFINFPKTGQQAEAIARDGAVLLSLALQYGVPLDSIRSAVTRDERGEPGSIVGAVVDKITTKGWVE